MPDTNLKYTSENVETGSIFDILVGNLLAYRAEEWGWSEQDYTKISEEFADAASNDLYYLPHIVLKSHFSQKYMSSVSLNGTETSVSSLKNPSNFPSMAAMNRSSTGQLSGRPEKRARVEYMQLLIVFPDISGSWLRNLS